MTKECSFFNDYSKLMSESNKLSKSNSNPFHKSKYVPLPEILQEAKRICLSCNFILVQMPCIMDNQNCLKTELIHKTGEKIESIVPLVAKNNNDPQKIGSAITYMRRYSICSILGFEEVDDDGNRAASKTSNYNNATTKQFDLIKSLREELKLSQDAILGMISPDKPISPKDITAEQASDLINVLKEMKKERDE